MTPRTRPEESSDHRGSRDERPSTLQITVIPGPRTPGIRDRIADLRPKLSRRVTIALVVALAVAVVAVILVAVAPGGHAPVRQPAHPVAPLGITGPEDPIAQAYRSPLRCLIMTVAATDPTYVRAVLNRANTCSRTSAWVTAILHQVDGMWRPVLVGTEHRCPVALIPAAVQAQLGVCPLRDRIAAIGRESPAPGG
jgi:hypothetical protein